MPGDDGVPNLWRLSKTNIQAQRDDAWSVATRYFGLRKPPLPVSGEGLDRFHTEAARHGKRRFEPWLTIFETAVTHLSGLFLSMARRPARREETDPWGTSAVLLGTACAHASGIRRLVLAGLDSSARVLHRTMLDTLAALVFSLSDKAFRDGFGGAQDVDTAKAFWLKNLRYDKVHRRLTELEKAMGYDEGLSAAFLAHRQEALARYSGYVHGLFTPAAFTAMVPSALHPGEVRPGILGHSSLMSLWTLDEATKSLGYFVEMCFHLLRRPPPSSGLPEYPFNKRRYFDRTALVACHTFLHLLSVHWNDIQGLELPWDPPQRHKPRAPRRGGS